MKKLFEEVQQQQLKEGSTRNTVVSYDGVYLQISSPGNGRVFVDVGPFEMQRLLHKEPITGKGSFWDV